MDQQSSQNSQQKQPNPQSQKSLNKTWQIVALVVAGILVIGGVSYSSYYFWQRSAGKISQKACTQEAKLCPDGSSVGRAGPNCEFAPCPSESLCEGGACPSETKEICDNFCGDGVCQEIVCMAVGCPCPETKESCPQDCAKTGETADWKTYRGHGFEIKYPPTWDVMFESSTQVVITNKDNDSEEFGINIYDNINPQKLSSWEWFESQRSEKWPENFDVKATEIEIILNNNISAFKDLQSDGGIITIFKDNDIYSLENGISMERKVIEKNLFYKIVNTFKFIK